MEFSLILLPILLLPIIGVIAGVIVLQVFLSKRDNKWLGLIMPILTFLPSLLIVLSLRASDNFIDNIFMMLATFIGSNIPTIVLILIYLSCRGKIKREAELEKMNIHDLE